MHVKILQRGKKLYRGSFENYKKPFSENRSAVYFANSRNNANIYSGHVTEYTLNKNAKVLNMGNTDTVQWLMGMANSNILKKSLEKAFRIANNKSIRRFSKIKYDVHIADFVCRLGFDGYYAPRLRTKYSSGYFASETVLCKPSSMLVMSKAFSPTRPPNYRLGRSTL